MALKLRVIISNFNEKGILYKKKGTKEAVLHVIDERGLDTNLKCRFFNKHGKGKTEFNREDFAWVSKSLGIDDVDFTYGVAECTKSRQDLYQKLHDNGVL